MTHLWEDSRLLFPSHTHTTHTHAGNTYTERLIGKLWRNVPYKIHCLEASFASAQSIAVKIAETEKKIADLEDKIRECIYQHPGSKLYVVTGPVLDDGLSRIERGANKVSVPKYYWKVVLDKELKKAIGFILPNAPGTKPLELYSVAIDSVERLTGLSFFTALSAGEKALLGKQKITKDWFSEVARGDVEPVPIEELKRGQISTIMAPSATGSSRNVIVVGKVVSGRVSRAGNVLLNLDKQYPNEIFTVFIKKEDLVNFGYDPVAFLKGKRVAVTGRVSDLGGKPTMYIGNGKDVEVMGN